MSNPPPKVQKSEEEWRAVLNKEQFRILREKGTERAGTGEYEHHKDDGADSHLDYAIYTPGWRSDPRSSYRSIYMRGYVMPRMTNMYT